MNLRANERAVEIPGERVSLPAILGLPSHARGVVLFAHGSGSGRFSPRNNAVARVLQDAGFATVLADLLAEPEAADRQKVFDIGLLAQRLLTCTDWVRATEGLTSLPVGYFGASTGGGAALAAAAQAGDVVKAVVSRGGRPDLAGAVLRDVRVPTLLIVGELDTHVLALNEGALRQLHSTKQLLLVPGATHLFEEPGAVDEVARLAREWFVQYLT